MRLSNQGQTLDSKAGVGKCEIICKKNCLLILILRLLLRQWKIQRSGRTKNLKMQEPEMPDFLVAYLLCRVSIINVCLECFRNTAIYFVPLLLLIIQSFSDKFLLDIQWLNKYLKCLHA